VGWLGRSARPRRGGYETRATRTPSARPCYIIAPGYHFHRRALERCRGAPAAATGHGDEGRTDAERGGAAVAVGAFGPRKWLTLVVVFVVAAVSHKRLAPGRRASEILCLHAAAWRAGRSRSVGGCRPLSWESDGPTGNWRLTTTWRTAATTTTTAGRQAREGQHSDSCTTSVRVENLLPR
jgi:hypothetical protein